MSPASNHGHGQLEHGDAGVAGDTDGVRLPGRQDCPQCGTEFDLDAAFCAACGARRQERALRSVLGDASVPAAADVISPSGRVTALAGALTSVETEGESKGLVFRLLRHLSPFGRTGREAFLQTLVILSGLYFAAFFVRASVYFYTNSYAPVAALDISIGFFVLFVLFPLVLLQAVKRLHDLDRPSLHLAFLLIPLWNVYEIFKLLFHRGTESRSEFGDNTPVHSSTLRRNSWGLVAVFAMFVIGTLWWDSSIGDTIHDVVAGDCFNSAASPEFGFADVEVVSCSGSWDFMVLDNFQVGRTGGYPGISYFEQQSQIRCPLADWFLYPVREAWQQGDRRITCLQQG